MPTYERLFQSVRTLTVTTPYKVSVILPRYKRPNMKPELQYLGEDFSNVFHVLVVASRSYVPIVHTVWLQVHSTLPITRRYF